MSLLFLATFAFATPHTETLGSAVTPVGGYIPGEAWDVLTNVLTPTVTVTLTGMEVWAYESDSGCSPCDAFLAVWTQDGSTGEWGAPTFPGTLEVSGGSAGWEAPATFGRIVLEAGTSYLIGVYNYNFVVYYTGTETDPVWGAAGGYAFAPSLSSWTDPTVEITEGAQLYMRLTVEPEDRDGDGSDALDDCDDTDSDAYPGGTETWYDGNDGDCAGGDDYDQDGDGAASDDWGGTDCEDTDADIHPQAPETWYDGVDQDCSGGSDYDQDGDGDPTPEGGGTDCNDTDAAFGAHAEEAWYDGIDQDCQGDSDYDQDGDGHETPSAGGNDCDDTDATVWEVCGLTDTGADAEEEDEDAKNGGACGCSMTSPDGAFLVAGLAVFLRRRPAAER